MVALCGKAFVGFGLHQACVLSEGVVGLYRPVLRDELPALEMAISKISAAIWRPLARLKILGRYLGVKSRAMLIGSNLLAIEIRMPAISPALATRR